MSLTPADEAQSSECPSRESMVQNRLAIGHLLLWMATTGVALVCLQAKKPRPPESIGFASFLSQGLSQEERRAEMEKRRLKIWRVWNARYVAGLYFAPVYGAALGGAVLSIWRAITRRLGFPIQPGHWLLVLVACLAVLVTVHPWMRRLPLPADTVDFVQVTTMAAIAITITVAVREPLRWRCALALAAFGVSMVCLAYIIGIVSPSTIEPPPAVEIGFGLGGIAIALFLFASVVCAMRDARERERYDIFHWVGIATLLGVAAHVVTVIGVGPITG